MEEQKVNKKISGKRILIITAIMVLVLLLAFIPLWYINNDPYNAAGMEIRVMDGIEEVQVTENSVKGLIGTSHPYEAQIELPWGQDIYFPFSEKQESFVIDLYNTMHKEQDIIWDLGAYGYIYATFTLTEQNLELVFSGEYEEDGEQKQYHTSYEFVVPSGFEFVIKNNNTVVLE